MFYQYSCGQAHHERHARPNREIWRAPQSDTLLRNKILTVWHPHKVALRTIFHIVCWKNRLEQAVPLKSGISSLLLTKSLFETNNGESIRDKNESVAPSPDFACCESCVPWLALFMVCVTEHLRELFFIFIRAVTTKRYWDNHGLRLRIRPDTVPSHIISQNEHNAFNRQSRAHPNFHFTFKQLRKQHKFMYWHKKNRHTHAQHGYKGQCVSFLRKGQN